MAETKKKKNKRKKLTISEEDISLLLRRYSAAAILSLLQEVSRFVDAHNAKINWNELVKKTSTGISNAREYQMLWRNLAYRCVLDEHFDYGAEPMDDDSDLESELEAFPPVRGEAALDVVAFAKVLLGPVFPSDSGSLNRSTVEAPLFINIPDSQATTGDSNNPHPACTQGKNITVPVFVEKQSKPTAPSAEGLDGSGTAANNTGPRKKRKPWTEEEDLELIAAVQKSGERNWANILKGDFKGDRSASQLSQRWAIIKKRQTNSSGGSGNPSNTQLTEAQLATRRAVSHALNMPIGDNLLAARSSGATHSSVPSSSAAVPSPAVPSAVTPPAVVPSAAVPSAAAAAAAAPSGPEDIAPVSLTQQPHNTKVTSSTTSKSRVTTSTAKKGPSVPSSPAATPSAAVPSGAAAPSGPEDIAPVSLTQQAHNTKVTSNTASKSRVTTSTAKKGSSVPFNATYSSPNTIIQATAVAAGARIAPPSTAASHLKAAQSKNVVHIRPGGGNMNKALISGVSRSASTSYLGSHPNVHFIRTGLVPPSAQPTYSAGPNPSVAHPGSSQQEHGNSKTKMVACSLPLSNVTSTLPSKQVPSSPTVSCGTGKGNLINVVSSMDIGPLSKEDTKYEEKKEEGSEESWHMQADFQKLDVLTDNQTTCAENLMQPHNVDSSQNKQLHGASKPSESSSVMETEACPTAMDEA